MPSQKFRNMNTGRSVRNAANNFLSTFSSATASHYDTIFSSADMARSLEESGLNELAHLDKRSAHNALERQRRENLNTKFQQLAHALPSLQSVRRPSKTVIVAKSLEFVSNSMNRENLFQKRIQLLRRENERLRDEAQQRAKLRQQQQQGITPASSKSSSCSSSVVEQPMYLSPEQLMLQQPPATSSPSAPAPSSPSSSVSASPLSAATTAEVKPSPITTPVPTITTATTTAAPVASPVTPMTRQSSTAESVASSTKAAATIITADANVQTKQHDKLMVVGSGDDHGLSVTAEQPVAQPNVYGGAGGMMAFAAVTTPQHLTSTPQSTLSILDQHPSTSMVGEYYLRPRSMLVTSPPSLPPHASLTPGMQQHMIPPFSADDDNSMMPFSMMDMSFADGGAAIHPPPPSAQQTTSPPVAYMPDATSSAAAAAAAFQFQAMAAAAAAVYHPPPPAYNAHHHHPPEPPTAHLHSYNQQHW